MASHPNAWQTHKGFIIEALRERGKWRIKVTKADRSRKSSLSKMPPAWKR